MSGMSAPALKRAASISIIAAGAAYASYVLYNSFFTAAEEEEDFSFSIEENREWQGKLEEKKKEVMHHKLKGLPVGGLEVRPHLRRARTLPRKERETPRKNAAPPRFRKAISSPDVFTKSEEEFDRGDVKDDFAILEKEDIKETNKTFQDFQTLTEQEQDDLLDDLLASSDDELVEVDTPEKALAVDVHDLAEELLQTKYEEHPEIVYGYNILVEHFPESVLKGLYSFLDVNDHFRLGRESYEVSRDVYCDNPKIIVEGVSDMIGQPSLVFTIGAPGSGKTTWAKMVYGEEAVIAADDYFDLHNGGKFDVKLLSTAHQWCKDNILVRLENNQTAVSNNTNTTLKEMYDLTTAVIFGLLPHKIVFAIMPEMNAKVLLKRNQHSVPMKSIKNMIKNIEKAKRRGHSVNKVLRAGPMPRRRDRRTKYAKKILYTGIFVEKKSMMALRNTFCEFMDMPLLPKLMNGHITLEFGPTQNHVDGLPKGMKARVRVLGFSSSKKVQCARVEILDQRLAQMCSNEHAHISLAVEHGFGPVLSNNLLKYGGWLELEEELILDCTVGYFTSGKNSRIDISAPPRSLYRSLSGFWLGDEDMAEELR